MAALARARTITVSIDAPAAHVYAFASDPRTMPRWMGSFVRSVRPDGEAWLADTTLGAMRFRFAPRNEFGVLDHDVTLPSGVRVTNPMRVVPNGRGCEVMFTLVQAADASDAQFEEDAAMVARDLGTLRRVVEAERPRGAATATTPDR